MKFTKWLKIITESADNEAIESMLKNKNINANKLKIGSLTAWALNFTRDVFTKSLWADETTKARGLFVTLDGSEKRVLARAYDKFFNLGEMVAGKKETIDSMELKYPVTAWHKYNGYLGIMSVAHNALDVSNIIYTGVFFDTIDFKRLINNINNKYNLEIKINRDPLHVTLYYYNSDNEKHTKINELSKIENTDHIKYTPKEIYIAKNGNKELITLKVETNSILKSNTTPHITLFAKGFEPKESADLIDKFAEWEKNHNAIKFKIDNESELEGVLGHYMNNKEIQKINNNDILFVASKSTNEHNFANMFQKILITNYMNSPKKLVELKDYLGKNNYSMAFEVIEPDEDAHIIKYSNAKIVLLDIIQNNLNFKSIPYVNLTKKAGQLKLNIKKPIKFLKDRDALDDFIKEINDPNYKLEKEGYTEGFVFQDAKNYMFKFKTNYYNYWKKMRSVTDAMVKALYDTSTPIKTSKIQDVFINMTSGVVQSYFGAIDKIPETNSKEILAKEEILKKKKSDAVKSLCGFIEKIPAHMIDSNLKKNIITEIQNFINKLFAKKRDKLQIEEIANTFENINIFLKQREPDDKIKNAGNVALEKMKNLIMKANPELFKKSNDNKTKELKLDDNQTELSSEPDMEQEKAFINFLAKNPHLLEKVKIGDKLKSPSIVQLRDAYEKENTPIKIKYNLYKVEDNAGDEDGDDDGGDKKNEDTNLENLWKTFLDWKAKLKSIPSNVHIIINRNEDAKLIKDLNLKTKTLIIASGVMGSGKSTWIKYNLKKLSKDELEKLSKDDLKKLKDNLKTYTVRSTDDEFMKNGKYEWSQGGLPDAHQRNLENAKTDIDSGQNVVIDNTNLKPSEFEKYINYAKSKGYEIIFLIFATDPKKILGDEGVNSPERIKIGKDFSRDMKKIHDKINSFYNGGIQQIINKAEKFK